MRGLLVLAMVIFSFSCLGQSKPDPNIKSANQENKKTDAKNNGAPPGVTGLLTVQNKIATAPKAATPNSEKEAHGEMALSEFLHEFIGDDGTAHATWTLVCVVLLQLLWMIRQERILDKSIGVAEQAADAAELQAQAAIGLELPRFIMDEISKIDDVTLDESDNIYSVNLTINFANHGRTEANVISEWVAHKFDRALPDEVRYPLQSHRKVPLGTIAKPGGYHICEYKFSIGQIKAKEIKEGKTILWVYGYFRYKDFMNAIHIEGFCIALEPAEKWIGNKPLGKFVDGENARYTYNKREK